MVLTTISINDIIYFLLQNIEIINFKNEIFNIYIKNNKDININKYEKEFYIICVDTMMVLKQTVFWSIYIPFNQEFLLFAMIYYIFRDKQEYIKKLLIIENTREIFHYIRQLFYRNTVGYYNENDELDYDYAKIKKMDGIVSDDDLLEDLNEEYQVIENVFIKNQASFKNRMEPELIEKEQEKTTES